MTTAKSRLRQILVHYDIGQTAFEKKVGISNGYINNLKGSIGSVIIAKITTAFPDIRAEWLLTGEGSMLKESTENETVVESSNKGLYNLVPVYNFDAVGSMDKSNDITDTPAYIERYVPFLGARKEDMCIHVTGNSMAPTYCPGSLLLVREVKDWREYFGYGHCFMLFLRDGRRILKEVQKFAENPKEYITCVSHNEEYPAEELPKNMITAVYKVIMALTNEGF